MLKPDTDDLGAVFAGAFGGDAKSARVPAVVPVDPTAGRAPSVAGTKGKRPKLEYRATALAHDLMDGLEAAVQRGEMDPREAVQALPVLQRIREHAEKMELQKGGEKLTLISFRMILNNPEAIAAADAADAAFVARKSAPEVIDMESGEPVDQIAAPTSNKIETLSFGFAPDVGGAHDSEA